MVSTDSSDSGPASPADTAATPPTPPTPAAALPRDWIGHIVVCGLRGVGLRIVEQLHRAGTRVVVVDPAPDRHLAEQLDPQSIPLLRLDPAEPVSLEAAGLAGAMAIICVLSDDLQTLRTALLVRQARPEARIVVQMDNPGVGRALTEAGVAVLDVGRLSAPAVVEACLNTGVIPLDLAGGHVFVVVDVIAPNSGTLRSQFDDWAPIAVRLPDHTLLMCPGRDVRVPAGSIATLLGTPEHLANAELQFRGTAQRVAIRRAGLAVARAELEGRAYTGRGYAASYGVRTPARAATTAIRSMAGAFDRWLVGVLACLVMVIATSTVVLHRWYVDAPGHHLSLTNSFYLTVVTIGTVGFGDFGFRDQSQALRWFAIGEILVGTMMLTSTYALITNLLVSRRINESLGRGRVTGLVGHVIVVGLGAVGLRVVQELHAEGRDVVVIEADESAQYLPQVRALGVPVVIADATLPETVAAAQVADARAVAVMTSDDMANLETGLAVRDHLRGPGPGSKLGLRRHGEPTIVLRLFDRQLAHTVQDTFGFTHVRSTAALAAPWFVGAALGLDILSTFWVGDEPMLVGHLSLGDEGGLVGLTMHELSSRTRVIAIQRRDGVLDQSPRRQTRFESGDQVYLVGAYEELLDVLRRNSLTTAAVQSAVSP